MNIGSTCAQGRVCIGTHKKEGLVIMGGMPTMPLFFSIITNDGPIILIVLATFDVLTHQYWDNFGQEEVLSNVEKILYHRTRGLHTS